MKVTVPFGLPVNGGTGVMVVVNVIGCPNTEGLTEEVTTVVVDPTTRVRVAAFAL
jgi:hypothetical protein